MTNKAVGMRFKRWRLYKKLTQQAIGQKLGVGPVYICQIETQSAGLSQKSLQILFSELNLNITWLLTGYGEPDANLD